jgi:hypothetical protein
MAVPAMRLTLSTAYGPWPGPPTWRG